MCSDVLHAEQMAANGNSCSTIVKAVATHQQERQGKEQKEKYHIHNATESGGRALYALHGYIELLCVDSIKRNRKIHSRTFVPSPEYCVLCVAW